MKFSRLRIRSGPIREGVGQVHRTSVTQTSKNDLHVL